LRPEWVEPLAAFHQAAPQRPPLSKKNGAVMAKEKVTLYGLTLVNERTINFSRIDPALCRELFIRRALVEGDFETRHRFFGENRKLLAEVEALEHKSRRRDILVDDEDLFRFYDARLPEEVISARHFDKWWKEAQKQDPELLNFEKEMLMKGMRPTSAISTTPTSGSRGASSSS
jgi:ATP-dependent helicase HrpA